MRTHLKNARLIDGTGARPVEHASIVIERDTIVHAGPLAGGDEPTGDTRVIDAGGKTVIPGLIEAHLHLSYNNVKAIADLDLNCPPEYSTLVSAKNAELALECGYTAARTSPRIRRRCWSGRGCRSRDWSPRSSTAGRCSTVTRSVRPPSPRSAPG